MQSKLDAKGVLVFLFGEVTEPPTAEAPLYFFPEYARPYVDINGCEQPALINVEDEELHILTEDIVHLVGHSHGALSLDTPLSESISRFELSFSAEPSFDRGGILTQSAKRIFDPKCPEIRSKIWRWNSFTPDQKTNGFKQWLGMD